jgi:hypothetical protein
LQVLEREVKEKEAKKALARVSRDRFREFLQQKKDQGVITAISRCDNQLVFPANSFLSQWSGGKFFASLGQLSLHSKKWKQQML